MSPSKTLDGLSAEIDQVDSAYAARFTSLPRITRSLDDLDGLRGRLGSVRDRVNAEPADEDRQSLLSRIEERLRFLDSERAAIEAAQAGGSDARLAHSLAVWANLTHGRYRRNFAGQSRTTRDLGLLAELIAEQGRVADAMAALAARYDDPGLRQSLETVRSNRTLYLAERGEIVDARVVGSLDQQADTLAAVANQQFSLYAAHFAGKPRLSRRPALLQRLIDNLVQLADRMAGLEERGVSGDSIDANRRLIVSRVESYREELATIQQARETTTVAELVTAYANSANEIFEEYRDHFGGRDRASRDLSRLQTACDALIDLAAQMADIDRTHAHDQNARNLQIVLDHVHLYTREHDLIVEAQQPSRKG